MKQKMDISSAKNTTPKLSSVGPIPQKAIPLPLNIPSGPLSPWLRLAHIFRTEPTESVDVARKRRILDFELVLQCEGTAWIWVEEAGGSFDVGPGSIVFIPPDFVHAWANTTGTHIAVHFDLHFQPEIKAFLNLRMLGNIRMLDEFVIRQPAELMPSFSLEQNSANGLVLPLVTPLHQPHLLRENLEKLVQIYQTQAQFDLSTQLIANEVLCGALTTIAGEAASNGFASNNQLESEQRIMALLAELAVSNQLHFTSAELAEKCGMSQTTFRQTFNKVTGRNPHRYFEQSRIERAAQLLLQTERSINAIARSEGYDDPYHFSRVFKRVMGASPYRFRQNGYGPDSPQERPEPGFD
jgi:AraC-like DNA-binding protein